MLPLCRHALRLFSPSFISFAFARLPFPSFDASLSILPLHAFADGFRCFLRRMPFSLQVFSAAVDADMILMFHADGHADDDARCFSPSSLFLDAAFTPLPMIFRCAPFSLTLMLCLNDFIFTAAADARCCRCRR